MLDAELKVEADLRRTLTLFSALTRLLLPTFGYPTTPTVMLCLPDGLYAFRSFTRAGEVAVDILFELEEETERKGRVGVLCLRYRSHAWALVAGMRSA